MTPPPADSWLLKGRFTTPDVVAGQGSDSGPLIANAQLVAVFPVASLTWTLKLPETVGVPVMAPVEGFSVSPAGSVPTTE
jgi:hypothetical protein